MFTHPTGDPAEQSPRTRPAPELARTELVDAERAARPLPAGNAQDVPGERDALAALNEAIEARQKAVATTTAVANALEQARARAAETKSVSEEPKLPMENRIAAVEPAASSPSETVKEEARLRWGFLGQLMQRARRLRKRSEPVSSKEG